jgi:hypothetical protein
MWNEPAEVHRRDESRLSGQRDALTTSLFARWSELDLHCLDAPSRDIFDVHDPLSTEKVVVNDDNPVRALEIPLRISYRSSRMERRENLRLRRFGST